MSGMFDDLDKQAAAAAKPVSKKPTKSLFADLNPEASAAPTPAATPSPTQNASEGVPTPPDEASKAAGVMEWLSKDFPTPASSERKQEIDSQVGKGASDLTLVDKVIYSLYNKANRLYQKKIAEPTTNALGDLGTRMDQSQRTDVPQNPVSFGMGLDPNLPNKVGSTIMGIGQHLYPASLFELAQQVLLLKADPAKLDEIYAVGSAPIFKTAPNASSMMLNSIMEVPDPILRTRLLKKAAPLVMGREEALKNLGKLPVERLGVHEIDESVGKIFQSSGEKAGELFQRGLDSLTDKDLELFGGKRLVNQVKTHVAKNAENPAGMAELVGNFSQPQQRLIMRRGIGSINIDLLGSAEDEMLHQGMLPTDIEGFGKDFVKSSYQLLNSPLKPSSEEIEMARSLALRENLEQTAAIIAKKGVKEAPNLNLVEETLNARMPKTPVLQKLKEFATNLKDEVIDFFEFEHKIKSFPELRFELEQFRGYPRQASREAVSLIGSVTESLGSKEEYDTFRKFIILQDWKESLQAGEKVANNLRIEDVNGALAKLSEKITPSVMEAAERHYTVVKAVGQDLVRRGYLKEELLRDKYFMHKVISHMDQATVMSSGESMVRSGPRAPFRSYTLPRGGQTPDLIDTDYIGVMHRMLTKVKIDNGIDDLIVGQARKLDLLPSLDDTMRESLFGASGSPVPGGRYNINGKVYRGFRYAPMGQRFPAQTDVEKVLADALDTSSNAAELDKALKGTNQALSTQQVFLVPDEAADSLIRVNAPKKISHMYNLVANPTKVWKRVTLGTAGLPWQMANFVGSLEQLYREGDYAAIMKIPQAFMKTGKAAGQSMGLLSEDGDAAIKLARESGIFSSVASQPAFPQEAPELFKFMDNPTKFKEIAKTPLKLYDFVSDLSQNSPKLAKMMADTARIQQGLPVQTKAFAKELAGLTAQQQVVKNAKLTIVDFAVAGDKFNTFFRDLTFPFANFFYHNAKGWANYAARNPADMIAKFGVPYAAMQYWNWSRYPEVEKSLPPFRRYQPHVITGWLDEKGNHISVSFASTAQIAAKMVAGDALLARIAQVQSGDLALKDAVEAQVSDVVNAPAETARGMLNPMMNVMAGIAMNKKKKEEGGGPIVPDGLRGTKQGMDLQLEYAMNNMATPLSTFVRTEALQEAEPAQPFMRYLRYGPLDYTRALGLNSIDVARNERRMRVERRDDSEVLNNQNYANLEDAYVKSMTTGDPTEFHKLIQDYKPDKIYMPSGKSLSSYLKSPRVMARIVREKLKSSTDPAEREQLINELNDWQNTASLKSIKTTPKQGRAYVNDGSQASQ